MKKQLLYSVLLFFSLNLGFSASYENSENPPTCAVPTALAFTSVTSNSAVLHWTESGTATSWHVLILPLGAPAPLANTVAYTVSTTNPFVITGLAPTTSYDVYVRAVCSANDFSDWTGSLTVTTTIPPVVCGGIFTDAGGTSANYPNNSNSTVIVCPTVPGDIVTVTFTSFDVEAGQDALYVFQGPAAAGTQISSANPIGSGAAILPGGFWGNTIPGPFTSSTPDGCLTFIFLSGANNSSPGWVANVTCSPPGCFITPTNVTASSITSTSALLNWANTIGSASLWEVLVLPYGSPAPTATSFGTYTQSNSYVMTDLTQNNCYSAYVRTACQPGTSATSPWSVPVDFCMFNCENNGACPESLVLIAFLDSNNNGTKDSTEPFFNNGSFSYQVNSGATVYGSSNAGAFTIFENNPTNNYTLNFSINSNLTSYFSASAAYSNVNVPTGSGNTTYYFPVTQLQAFNDVDVQIIPYGSPRPGFNYSNLIQFKNNGTNTVTSGSVTFTKDPAVSIVNISLPVTSLPNGFSYDYTNLASGEIRMILVEMQVPTIPTVNLGQILTNSTSITPLIGDAIPANNSTSLSQIIVGSYDPNDKMEARGPIIPIDTFTTNDYLTYTIRFENTGTASAQFIRVEDELNALLNAGTVEVLSASHPYNFRRIGNKLIWNFWNINLPPTATNPTLSHGYIRFKVKPTAGFGVGTVIPNAASIYFDYNPPIVTETFNTTFFPFLNTTEFELGNFILSPNPTNEMVQISLQNNSDTIKNIVIYDVLGKVIKNVNAVNSNQTTVNVAEFSKGIYMVEVTTENDSKQIKKLVIK